MKKIYFALCILTILSAFKPEDPIVKKAKFRLSKGVTPADYLPNTLIIKFKPATKNRSAQVFQQVTRKLTANGVKVDALKSVFTDFSDAGFGIQSNPQNASLNDIYELHYQGNVSIETAINSILEDGAILYAEPSYIYQVSYTPNDPQLSSQYYLNSVKAIQAWDVFKNASNVTIGIVDTGSDLGHEDLAGSISLNTQDPINGIDDDGDGYIDNYNGWDFVGASASTMIADNDPSVKSDTTDHGVHVSGIAGARSDNGRGVASVAFNAKLLIVKASADNNGRSIYKGYEGIKYAADHGAQIINCSWGGAGGGEFGQEIINYATAKGCLVVAAAGNENTDVPIYPAAYDNVFAVANIASNDTKASSSNFNYQVDISAYGQGIYNTVYNNRYGVKSGTSMASPLVASAAALVKAKNPQLTGIQVGEVLRRTADPIDQVNPSYLGRLGSGKLNVYRALTETPSSVKYQAIHVNDDSNGSRVAGGNLTLSFDLKNLLQTVTGLTAVVSSNSPYVQLTDASIAVGTMNTLENKLNQGQVKVRVLSGTPANTDVVFNITYTANNGTYVDSERFVQKVALDYLNITVNQVNSTLSSNGRVGFSEANASEGLGFIYKNENMLYEASLMIGRSATQVSNNTRSGTGSSEDFVKLVGAKLTPNSKAAFEGTSEYNDQGSANPLNVKVKTTMLAFNELNDDKYVIAVYEITNNGKTDLTNIYTSLFTDWDLDESSANATRYDTANKLAYVYAKRNVSYPYAGVKLLKHTSIPSYYPMSYQASGDPLADNNFTIAEKYAVLSSGIKALSLGDNVPNGLDVMFSIGSGPYQIPAGASISVAYAFIGGDNAADLVTVGNAASNKYDSYVATTPGLAKPLAYALKQNYPNAATTYTRIPFELPEASQTSLIIRDIQGRTVQKLVNQNLAAGSYDIYVDLQSYAAGVYTYQLTSGSYKQALKMIVVK